MFEITLAVVMAFFLGMLWFALSGFNKPKCIHNWEEYGACVGGTRFFNNIGKHTKHYKCEHCGKIKHKTRYYFER